MPFHPPSATSDLCLSKRLDRSSGVKQSDGGVVTTNGNKMFDMWMALNASHASIEPRHPIYQWPQTRIISNTPFVGDNRLVKTLTYIPHLQLQVISSF
jgi:hypothetical protein